MDKKIIAEPDVILAKSEQSSINLANIEAESFSNEELEQVAKKNEHGRREGAKNIFHYGNILLLIVVFTGIIISVLVMFFHWVSPQQWHFLLPNQIDTIKTILFSALATTCVKEFYKKSFNN